MSRKIACHAETDCGVFAPGWLLVDRGALQAVMEQSQHLLCVGVVSVAGSFRRGDHVFIADAATGVECAVGEAQYDAAEINQVRDLTLQSLVVR
jgi:glutamate 5-kinase